MKFGFDWPSGFRGEEIVKLWTNGWTDDDTTEHSHPISSSSGELKMNCCGYQDFIAC